MLRGAFLKEALSSYSLSSWKAHKWVPKYLIIPLHELQRHHLLKTGLMHGTVLSVDAHLSSWHSKNPCKNLPAKDHSNASCVDRHTKHTTLVILWKKDPKDLWGTSIFYVKISNTWYPFSLLSHFSFNQIFSVITSFSDHHKNGKALGQPVSLLSFCIFQTTISFWYKSKLHHHFT